MPVGEAGRMPQRGEGSGVRGGLTCCWLVLAGCTGGDWPELCSGGDAIVLGIRVQPPASRVTSGQQVMFDNGSPFLFVDGQCRYWVAPRNDRWADTRTGTLSVEDASALASEVGWHDWDSLPGGIVPGEAIFDADTIVLQTPTNRVECFAGCFGSELPTSVRRATENMGSWIDQLWASGVPLDGGVWMIAVSREDGMNIGPATAWPLDWDIADVAVDGLAAAGLGYGDGHYVSPDLGADALRVARARHRAGLEGEDFWYGQLPFVDAMEQRYVVYMRDALPLEGPQGIVP